MLFLRTVSLGHSFRPANQRFLNFRQRSPFMAYFTISIKVPKCFTISGGFTTIFYKSAWSNDSLSIDNFQMRIAACDSTMRGLSLTVIYPYALFKYGYICLVQYTQVSTLRVPWALKEMKGGDENKAQTDDILMVSMTGRGSAQFFNFGISTESVWLSISIVDVISVLFITFYSVNISLYSFATLVISY